MKTTRVLRKDLLVWELRVVIHMVDPEREENLAEREQKSLEERVLKDVNWYT
jgi:hypothetical protein